MVATLREKFNHREDELREILTIDSELSREPLESLLRAIVDTLKEPSSELRILSEGEHWIEDFEARAVSAATVELKDFYRASAERVRVVRLLAELAIFELADEGELEDRAANQILSEEIRRDRAERRRNQILSQIGTIVQHRVEGFPGHGDEPLALCPASDSEAAEELRDLPALNLEEEENWESEVDQWIEELSEEGFGRRASLLRALAEAAWKLEGLNR